jgi:MoaA/NifB/PqqE/SkfB family radical SAM enzyme
MAVAVDVDQLRLVWLELTGRCQLRCTHCYAESGPESDHGTMTADDWRRVLDESAAVGAQEVVIIGGEPTLHPDLPELVRYALDRGMRVEVFSNLARPLPDALWALFETPGVRLATSYYSADARTHEKITLGPPGEPWAHACEHRRGTAQVDPDPRRHH